LRDRAEHFAGRLTDYLCSNSSLFPEYSTNSDEDIRPINSNTFHGISLDYTSKNKYEKETGQRY
jgi:hypothetical protein